MLKRRLLSWFWDYLVILGLLMLVFIVVGIPTLVGWVELDAVWTDPVLTDLAITMLTVVPFLGYLVVMEAGSRHGTWGKRREGLRVIGVEGSGPERGQIVVRNVVKILPWQFGHMGAARFAHSEGNIALAIVFDAISILVLAAVVTPPLLGRRGLHEILAGSSVEEDTVFRTGDR